MHFGHILKVKYCVIYFDCNLYRVYGAMYNCNVFFTVAQYEYINIWIYNVFFKNSTWIELHGVQTNLITKNILLHSGWFRVLRCNNHTEITWTGNCFHMSWVGSAIVSSFLQFLH